MRSKTKTGTPGIQVLLSIEKTHPLERRLRPEPVDAFDLLISMADPLIGRHEVVLIKRVDLPVVESALLAPEFLGKRLGLARLAGPVVALLALELFDRCAVGHQAATFAIKQPNLLNHWVTGLIEQELVAVAIGVFGQEIGIKRVVFAVMLGLDFLQDRGLLQRTDPPPECDPTRRRRSVRCVRGTAPSSRWACDAR